MQNWAWISPPPGDPRYRLATVADIDGNGTPDIVWQNVTTGDVAVWFMGGANNTLIQSWAWISPPPGDARYRLAGVADLNQDGIQDMVWQNFTTLDVAAWFTGPGRLRMQTWGWLSYPGITGWQLSAVQ